MLPHLAVCIPLDSMKPVLIRSGLQETLWFVRVLAALALLAIGGAVREWLTPATPPFRGRWAWFIEAVFSLAGSTGLLLLWVLLAVALAATARFVWRHTSRAPADSWLW